MELLDCLNHLQEELEIIEEDINMMMIVNEDSQFFFLNQNFQDFTKHLTLAKVALQLAKDDSQNKSSDDWYQNI